MEWTTDVRHVDAVHLHFLETESLVWDEREDREKKGKKGGSIYSQVKHETGCSKIRVRTSLRRNESLEINGIGSFNEREEKGGTERV